MKIKEQTRKLAAGCSKYSFEVADKTDEVSNHTHSKATLTRFEEIFEEYKLKLESLFNNKGEKTWLNTVLLEQDILGLS